MNVKRSLILLFSSYGYVLFGQEKVIDTVYVFDNQMKKVKLFHKIQTISPQDVEKNSTNLSELLRFQTPIYIKENGRGAVSSPSFRGTTAQQTAFVWNGININSQFLGQADINNISFRGFDQLEVKAGGGSVIYGSGAIGGSVHLNNTLSFNKGFHASLFSEAASYGTFNNFTKASYSNNQFSFKISGNYSVSKNNYEVKESQNYSTRNGEYNNTNFNFAAAYKIAPHHQISWISEFFNGNQNYPVFFDSQTKTKYETQNIRSLIAWDWNQSKFTNSFKAAYTEENFQYFSDIAKPYFSGGTGKNYIIKNDFNYFITPKWNFNLISEFQLNKAEGLKKSQLGEVNRNTGSFAGLIRYFTTTDLRFEAGIKKDVVQDISAPLLFSFSGKWDTTPWYHVNLDISKNFRYPSFNDLYWRPGGNLELKPETSYQVELGNQFKISDVRLSLTPYYIRIYDMIVWQKSESSYYSATNVTNVRSYGIEAQLGYAKKWGHHNIQSNIGYSYTISTDLEKEKQLMYVPFHKAFGTIDYQYAFLRLYVQGLFNGLTYTSSDAKKEASLNPYFVMNTGVSATLLTKYTVGFKINNIFNTIYYTMLSYPLPKRNYSLNFTINF